MGADLVSRQELYEMVWSMPMIKVAEQFKVSGSYMARVCSALRVPRPERGHWAKLAVGKAPEGLHCRRHSQAINSVGPGTEDCSRHLGRDLSRVRLARDAAD
jgi:hypothetical protein